MAATDSPRRALEPSEMLERPGFLAWLLFRFFFTRRFVRADDREALKEYAERYRVVYVGSHKHVYNALWLNRLLVTLGLPLARLVTGVVTLVFQPLWRMLLYAFGRRPRSTLQERTRELLDAGHPLMVFLRKGRRSGRAGICPGSDDVLRASLEAAREGGREIVFVPLSLFWGHAPLRPDSGGSRRLQRLLGSAEDPGAFRSFLQLFVHFRAQRLRLGPPLCLSEFLAAEGDEPIDRLERHLRYELAGRIERVRRVQQGPRRKGAVRIREEVLRGVALRKTICDMAAELGEPEEKLRKQARKYLKEIAADPRPGTLRVFRWFLRHFVWDRVYDGLEADPHQMDRLREAAARGPLLFLPTHRSHVDYLLLSWIVAEHDVAPPCIAAGKNLSFFPIGSLFRRSGAFFIRRSFWKNRLYTACLTDYLRKILVEGYSLEFFIEGTRSRTGKMYTPRIGLLKWIADAAIAGRVRNAQVVPVAVGYEKVIEERSVTREAAGGKKKKEDVGAVLRAGRVLASRFGRLNLQIGEPYDLRQALADLGATRDASPEQQRAATVQLAYRITHEIAMLCPVTPTSLVSAALVLTGEHRVSRDTVVRLCRWLTPRLRAHDAVFTRALVAPPPVADGESEPEADLLEIREDGMERALLSLAKEGAIRIEGTSEAPIYRIVGDRRASLGYYRNGLINFLVAESIVARAVLATEAEQPASIPVDVVRRRAQFLSRVWKYEFVFRVGESFDDIFDATLERLGRWELELQGDELRIAEAGRSDLELAALLLQDYFEAYRIAVIGLTKLLAGPLGRKELVRRMRDDAIKAAYRGELLRRESCNRITFDNAVSALVDLDVLEETVGRKQKGTPMALAAAYHEDTAITALLDRLNRLRFQDHPSHSFDPSEASTATAE